jgi:tetratricopeptide (TPR) repeat protein
MAENEALPTSPDNLYTPLFHRYIHRSLSQLAARLGPENEPLSNEVREQAWHLLDYALNLSAPTLPPIVPSSLPEIWEQTRDLLLSLAPRMERDGFRREWLPYVERGIDVCRQLGDRQTEARLTLAAGRIYRLRGDYAAANERLTSSAAVFQQLANPAGRAQSLNQLAYVARLQSHFDQARAYVDEAFGLLQEDDPERASSHWVLGTMATALMDWEAAERHHRAALEIWQAAGDRQRAAWSLQNVGNAQRGAGRYAEAAATIQHAIVLLGELNDPVNQAIARMNRGIVHIYDHDPAQALALFHLAEPVFRQVGDQLHLAMVYTNMTIVERDLGHFEAAMQSGKRATHYAEIIGDQKMMANALDELGLVLLAQGERAEAGALFEQGLSIIRRVPPDAFQQMVSESLATHLAQTTDAAG